MLQLKNNYFQIEKWFSLWDDRLQLESQTKDPSRLGNFKVLREEEKRRKRVNQGLPKVIDEIKNLTQEYYDQNGKDFLISGKQRFSRKNIDDNY